MPLLAWCLLLMAAWGLWLWRLDGSDLTFDETATYIVAARPLLDILAYLRGAIREHPPVYYLLMHVWMAGAGYGEFSLRLFSVCVGLVALALTGWVARLVTGRSGFVALVPAALLAVMPGMTYYARDARMYSLCVVWALLSTGLFLRDWLPTRDWPGRASLLGLMSVHVLALFTHYYLLLPILVQPLTLLIARRWRPLLAWCATHSLPAAAALTWLMLAPGHQATATSMLHLNPNPPTVGQVLYLVGRIIFGPPVLVNMPLLYVILALTGVGSALAVWRRWRVGIWLALMLTLPLALAYLVPNPPAPRHLIFLTPFFALALGYACAIAVLSARIRWPAWVVTLGLAVVVARLLMAFDKSHYSRTLETVKANLRPGDGLLFYGPWQGTPFRYYDPGGLPHPISLPPYAPPHLNPAEAEPVLEGLLAQHGRLWVLPAAVDDVDPPHYAEGWLRTHAHAVWRSNDFTLYLPPLPADAPVQDTDVTFGQTLLLEQVAYEPQPVPAGEPLRLTLYWKPLVRLENNVQLTLSLVDRNGQVWDVAYSVPGQWATPPVTWQPGQVISDYEGLMVPQGAPPGEYAVRLRVDDVVSGELLPTREERGADLLTIQVGEPIHPPVLYGMPGRSATFCAPGGDNCLTLAGYEPGGLRFQQGYPLPCKLHWLVPAGTEPEVQIRLQVIHRSWLPGLRTAPIVTRTLALPSYVLPPTSGAVTTTPPFTSQVALPLVCRNYSEGPDLRLLTMPEVLHLPPDATTGPAQVMLEVVGADGTAWPTIEGDRALRLFGFALDPRPVLRRLPGGMTRVEADFGEVGLRGYRVAGDPRPGGEIRITYIWYARVRPTAIYAVFNHLLTADGTPIAQVDGWPQEGRMLTTQWQPGEYIEDSYTLAIPADAPPGPYTLTVGLYNAANNERQPAFLDGQRLPDGRLPITVGD